VRLVRRAADRMTAAAPAGVDTGVSADFDAIRDTRRRIFGWKLSTKFLVGALNAAGTVGTLMLGGWLVIEGETDVGTVVAATIALARLQGPRTALIAFYRQASAMRVRYALFRDALAPD
jgi:ABC-type multidrug transport system fused ATPase/permease subunit